MNATQGQAMTPEEAKAVSGSEVMCPHCGETMPPGPLTPTHDYPKLTRQVCPGSEQHPRSVYDRRFLWNGERPRETPS